MRDRLRENDPLLLDSVATSRVPNRSVPFTLAPLTIGAMGLPWGAKPAPRQQKSHI